MQTAAMLRLTLYELWAKKITIGLFLVSTLVWVMLLFALNLDIVDGVLVGLSIFGQDSKATETITNPETGEVVREALSLDQIVLQVESFVSGAAYWAGTLLGLFATASLLPSLLERGRGDLLLSKPISRTRILSAHVLGVWLTVLVLAVYLLGMVWIIMSLKSGIWHGPFLLAIPLVVCMFGVMYSVVTLISVTTRSASLALIVAYGLIFASLILVAKDELAPQITLPWRYIFLSFYHTLPKFGEVTQTVTQLAGAKPVASWYPFASSLLFGIVMYAAAFISFKRRDF